MTRRVFLLLVCACTDKVETQIGKSGDAEACNQVSDCKAGFDCVGEEGQPKTCKTLATGLPKRGTPCTSTADCKKDETDLVCGTQQVCTQSEPKQVGDECAMSFECASGICSGKDRKCKAESDYDASCRDVDKTGDPTCAGTLSLKRDATGELLLDDRGNVQGDKCSLPTDCRLPLVCSVFDISNPTCARLPFFAGPDCSASNAEVGAFRVYHEHPDGKGEFYRSPHPTDARADAAGHTTPGALFNIDVAGSIVAGQGSYSASPVVFFRTTDPLLGDTVIWDEGGASRQYAYIDGDPTVEELCKEDDHTDDSVYLVARDDTNQKHIPIAVQVKRETGQYICQNSLSLRPLEPLTPGTTYVAVISAKIRGVGCRKSVHDTDFAADVDDPESAVGTWLTARGIDKSTLAGATVFTVTAPTDLPKRVGDAAAAAAFTFTQDNSVLCPPETVTAVGETLDALKACHNPRVAGAYIPDDRSCPATTAGRNFHEMHARVTAPFFQKLGDPVDNDVASRFLTDHGAMEFVSGVPTKTGDEQLCVSIAVPTVGNAPWPVVVFAHGTDLDEATGDAQNSVLPNPEGHYRTAITSGLAARLAAKGFAVVSYDAVGHGARMSPALGPSPEKTAILEAIYSGKDIFQSGFNPTAMRDNVLQGVADLAHLVAVLKASTANVHGVDLSFADDKIFFLGHAQGAQIGAVFLAGDTTVKAAVLASVGGSIPELLLGSDVLNTMGPMLLDIAIDRAHPMMGLLSHMLSTVDPLTYAGLLATGREVLIVNAAEDDGHVGASAQEFFEDAADGAQVVTKDPGSESGQHILFGAAADDVDNFFAGEL
jgi:fermentation-respiration switch protein FrsA (DUF1100 family)